ncbi:MAG: NAD(P)H-dependent oxidoreductase subunit E [Verrucomicrobiae bacterium]|nr:NAD(P)H-dependent oxidoreductase subunit E [Verrucomicrobiae bacterium]
MKLTTIDGQQIKQAVGKWKDKPGNLIMMLHEVQGCYGYVPREVALKLSHEADVPLARIYEVITFYNYFKLQPPGKFNIAVCMGTACYLKGAPELMQELKNRLSIDEGQTTGDGMFHLDGVRCLGCCGLAPVVAVNGRVHAKVKKGDIIDILSKCKKEANS